MPTLRAARPPRHRDRHPAAPLPHATASTQARSMKRIFFAWTNTQTALLRSGRLAQADIEHIAEEIEGMGKSELRELENRLAVLLLQLLKWQFQPQRRGRSWELTIREQRRKLRRYVDGDATLAAARETDLPEATFPPLCPYTVEQISMTAGCLTAPRRSDNTLFFPRASVRKRR